MPRRKAAAIEERRGEFSSTAQAASVSGDVKTRALAVLREQILACTRCRLAQTRTQAVPGEGPANARVMVIGEAPGRNEDLQGRPFVGHAGRFLNRLLEEAGLRREDVYITNVVKSRPTDVRDGPNRAPKKDEVAACAQWLGRELTIIRPRVVVTLGGHALCHFLPRGKITQVRGKTFEHDEMVIFPTLHPAAVLDATQREVLRRDFQKLGRLIQSMLSPR